MAMAACTGRSHLFAAHEVGNPLLRCWKVDWATKRLDRDEALANLTKRYFADTVGDSQDFAWWSGLKLSDARAGLEMIASTLRQETDGTNVYWFNSEPTASLEIASAYLLPGFDEYLLGYNDRQVAIDPKHAQKLIPDSNGRFWRPWCNGRVIGTWSEFSPRVSSDNARTFRRVQ
jgi:hypothetical protein